MEEKVMKIFEIDKDFMDKYQNNKRACNIHLENAVEMLCYEYQKKLYINTEEIIGMLERVKTTFIMEIVKEEIETRKRISD